MEGSQYSVCEALGLLYTPHYIREGNHAPEGRKGVTKGASQHERWSPFLGCEQAGSPRLI